MYQILFLYCDIIFMINYIVKQKFVLNVGNFIYINAKNIRIFCF